MVPIKERRGLQKLGLCSSQVAIGPCDPVPFRPGALFVLLHFIQALGSRF